MIAYSKRTDRQNSFIIKRGVYTREDRYIKIKIDHPQMPKIVKEVIEVFLYKHELSKGTYEYLSQIQNEKKEFTNSIGYYNGDYIIPFIRVGGIECAALRITYNGSDRELVREFVNSASEEMMNILQMVVYHIVLDKQKIRILDDKDTVGIIYQTYPLEDTKLNYGFIQYLIPSKAVDKFVLSALNGAISRGVSLDEIDQIIPDDPKSRFGLANNYDEYIISQIDALMPGIASMA